MSKTALLITLNLLIFNFLKAQVATDSDLFKTLAEKDSLLFNALFNTCDTVILKELLADDLEFYHDQAGTTFGGQTFLREGVINGLCKLSYKARREVDKASLQVFPLKKNGVLYGAIQSGKHRFYAKEKDKAEYFTSVALFTHVWILENGAWKLERVLSFNHQNKE
jgi:hypothetical protein